MKRKGIHSAEHRELVTLLFDLRRKADMTQMQVAQALGRPQTYISALEVGRRGIDLMQVRELCEVYGVSFPRFADHYERRLKAAVSQQRPPRLSSRKHTAKKVAAKTAAARTRSRSR